MNCIRGNFLATPCPIARSAGRGSRLVLAKQEAEKPAGVHRTRLLAGCGSTGSALVDQQAKHLPNRSGRIAQNETFPEV